MLGISYCRVSTASQEENTSLSAQDEANRQKLTQLGCTAIETYREVWTGADYAHRPQLTLLRDRVRRGGIAFVCATVLDRLSRNLAHLALFEYECEMGGARLVFSLDQYEDSPEGRLVQAVRGYAAELERIRIRERTASGRRRVVHERKRVLFPGQAKFGYFPATPEDPVRQINEAEAATVRRIYELAAAGFGHLAICKKLRDEGTLTDAGIPFAKSQISRILGDPAYKGEAFAFRWQGQKVNGKNKIRPRAASEHVRLPDGTIPAIVSADLWARANARRLTNRGDAARNEKTLYLLRGLILCAVCGRKMVPDRERAFRVYRCASRSTVAGACGSKRVPAEKAERDIWNTVRAYILDPAKLAALLPRGADERPSADTAPVRARIERLAAQQARLVAHLADVERGDVAAMIRAKLSRVGEEKDRLQSQLDAFEQEARLRAIEQSARLDALDYCAELAATIDEIDEQGRREVLERFGLRVVANGLDCALEFFA